MKGYKIDESTKLVPNLKDKSHYVVHYRDLKLYIQLGLEVTAVHKVMTFKQSMWLKEYIDMNTQLRSKAKNAFQKDFFKLANNSVFGKTMENVRRRCNIQLINDHKVVDEYRLDKKLSDPRIKDFTIYNDWLVAVEKIKKEVVIDKPIYLGFSILDLSKVLMYDFHYNYMLKKYGHENVKLLFTDTDSLCYHIKTEDFYEDIKGEDMKHFDTSDYPEDHMLFSNVNKKVIGKFKDEANGKPISEFVGLKPKMYAFTVDEPSKKRKEGLKKKAKGVKKCVVNQDISFKDYKNCVLNGQTKTVQQVNLRSYEHTIHTITENKLALSPIDTKRYICDDGISTYAYGHYKIHAM